MHRMDWFSIPYKQVNLGSENNSVSPKFLCTKSIIEMFQNILGSALYLWEYCIVCMLSELNGAFIKRWVDDPNITSRNLFSLKMVSD